ncbi:Potassium voltage-gated channel sub H member 5 [Perkinsus chesapeaki]|uniref:Potassium voltage-gated channel sub H member 5 n=1 Tax=Perkinsus chesapeaki TaxID=330153 RepID=A0A7J6N1I8_PERCH|nr:Potassium voltage-gated channel sub H member 5 [Perkinsus chesapeaki]
MIRLRHADTSGPTSSINLDSKGEKSDDVAKEVTKSVKKIVIELFEALVPELRRELREVLKEELANALMTTGKSPYGSTLSAPTSERQVKRRHKAPDRTRPLASSKYAAKMKSAELYMTAGATDSPRVTKAMSFVERFRSADADIGATSPRLTMKSSATINSPPLEVKKSGSGDTAGSPPEARPSGSESGKSLSSQLDRLRSREGARGSFVKSRELAGNRRRGAVAEATPTSEEMESETGLKALLERYRRDIVGRADKRITSLSSRNFASNASALPASVLDFAQKTKGMTEEDRRKVREFLKQHKHGRGKTLGDLDGIESCSLFSWMPPRLLSFLRDMSDVSGRFRMTWDSIGLILGVWQVLILPHHLAFNDDSYQPDTIEFLALIWVSDVYAGLNIAVCATTGYQRAGALITNTRQAMKHYAKTWLVFDLLSAFPWVYEPHMSHEALAIRMLRVLLVYRLSYLRHRVMGVLERRAQSEIWTVLLGIGKLVSLLIIFCHWSACLWWYIGMKGYYEEEGVGGWIRVLEEDRSEVLWTAPDSRQFTAALYFVSSTITTVGYGDISATNQRERVFCIILEIIAGNVFALFSGLLCALFLTYDEVAAQFRSRLKAVARQVSWMYMNRTHLDGGLQRRVVEFLEQLFENQARERTKTDLMELLHSSEGLQSEVLVGIMGKVLRTYPWFARRLDDEMLGMVAGITKNIYFAPLDIVFLHGERSGGMIFVANGAIKLVNTAEMGFTSYQNDAGMRSDSFVPPASSTVSALGAPFSTPAVKTLVRGGYCGEMSLFIEHYWERSAICVNFVEVYKLLSSDFDELAERMPTLHQVLQQKRLMIYCSLRTNDTEEEDGVLGAIEDLLCAGVSPDSHSGFGEHVLVTPSFTGNTRVLNLLTSFGSQTNVFYNITNHEDNIHQSLGNLGGVENMTSDSPTKNHMLPLQMALRSSSISAIAVLARSTVLSVLMMTGPDREPILSQFLACNKGIRMQLLAAAVRQNEIDVAMAIINDGLKRQQQQRSRGASQFDILSIFYGDTVENDDVTPSQYSPVHIAQRLISLCGIDNEGRNLLHLAAEQGHSDMVDVLINTGLFADHLDDRTTDPAYSTRDTGLPPGCGYTALHLATIAGSVTCVHTLIEAKASVTATNRLGETILDVAAKYDQREIINSIKAADLFDAARAGSIAVFETLSKGDGAINSLHPKSGCSPLYVAANAGKAEIVKKLIDLDADVNMVLPTTFTALYGAISMGHFDCVKILIEHGNADVTQCVGSMDIVKGLARISPLEAALKKGREDLVEIVLRHLGPQRVRVAEVCAALHKKNLVFVNNAVMSKPALLNDDTTEAGETLAELAVRTLKVPSLDVLKEMRVVFTKPTQYLDRTCLAIAAKANKDKTLKWLMENCYPDGIPEEEAIAALIEASMVSKGTASFEMLLPICQASAPPPQMHELMTKCLINAVEAQNKALVSLIMTSSTFGLYLPSLPSDLLTRLVELGAEVDRIGQICSVIFPELGHITHSTDATWNSEISVELSRRREIPMLLQRYGIAEALERATVLQLSFQEAADLSPNSVETLNKCAVLEKVTAYLHELMSAAEELVETGKRNSLSGESSSGSNQTRRFNLLSSIGVTSSRGSAGSQPGTPNVQFSQPSVPFLPGSSVPAQNTLSVLPTMGRHHSVSSANLETPSSGRSQLGTVRSAKSIKSIGSNSSFGGLFPIEDSDEEGVDNSRG